MFRRRVASENPNEQPLCSPYNIGVNAIFLSLIPYAVVTALHDTHLTLALILGTALSGGIILIGIIFRFAGGYRTWPYALELFMLVVNAVLLGMSYPEEDVVKRFLPFISNAFYAVFAVVSIMMTAPFTLQYVREFVPSVAATHYQLVRVAYATSVVWALAFVANTLIYLIPICRNREGHHLNVLNLLFLIIIPIVDVFAAVLVSRIWPVMVLQHLMNSVGFDGAMRKVVVNPLAFEGGAGGLPPPQLGPYSAYMPPPTMQVHAVAS